MPKRLLYGAVCALSVAMTIFSNSTAQPLDTQPLQLIPPNGEQGPFVIAGAGMAKCSKLNSQGRAGRPPQMLENELTVMMLGWVQGYMSGLNLGTAAGRNQPVNVVGYFDLASISVEEQWAFLTVYCQRNPDHNLTDAIIELMRKRLQWVR